jgi:hypothetical protein
MFEDLFLCLFLLYGVLLGMFVDTLSQEMIMHLPCGGLCYQFVTSSDGFKLHPKCCRGVSTGTLLVRCSFSLFTIYEQ